MRTQIELTLVAGLHRVNKALGNSDRMPWDKVAGFELRRYVDQTVADVRELKRKTDEIGEELDRERARVKKAVSALKDLLVVCGSCDAGLPMRCTCPEGDPRALILRVVQDLEPVNA